jgi:hypothetical protein
VKQATGFSVMIRLIRVVSEVLTKGLAIKRQTKTIRKLPTLFSTKTIRILTAVGSSYLPSLPRVCLFGCEQPSQFVPAIVPRCASHCQKPNLLCHVMFTGAYVIILVLSSATMPVEGFRSFRLGYDVLLQVLETFQDDYGNLYRCSLVNREYNEIASRILYSRVVLSPPFNRGRVNLKDQDGLSVSMLNAYFPRLLNICKECGQFVSSCLPRNATHATRFEISGRSLDLQHIT